MKSLKLTIDGICYEYQKAEISGNACIRCDLRELCNKQRLHDEQGKNFLDHRFCNVFDTTGKHRPTGVYGHFKVERALNEPIRKKLN
jgi:hypothetical protein